VWYSCRGSICFRVNVWAMRTLRPQPVGVISRMSFGVAPAAPINQHDWPDPQVAHPLSNIQGGAAYALQSDLHHSQPPALEHSCAQAEPQGGYIPAMPTLTRRPLTTSTGLLPPDQRSEERRSSVSS
jgi:hypothetical protein